jgi:hypothetical protein
VDELSRCGKKDGWRGSGRKGIDTRQRKQGTRVERPGVDHEMKSKLLLMHRFYECQPLSFKLSAQVSEEWE